MILSVDEAERYIESLSCFSLEEVGSSQWILQHEHLEKLNMQAHQSAAMRGDEYIVEGFLTFDKIKTLLHDLLLINIWKENVFPLVADDLVKNKCNMKGYFILYHEATVINLLEVLLYHKHVCEAAGEDLLDLVDLCMSKSNILNHGGIKKELEIAFPPNLSPKEQAERMAKR